MSKFKIPPTAFPLFFLSHGFIFCLNFIMIKDLLKPDFEKKKIIVV